MVYIPLQGMEKIKVPIPIPLPDKLAQHLGKAPCYPAFQASPWRFTKVLLCNPATTTATTEHEQPQTSVTSKAKAASCKVIWGAGTHTPQHPSTFTHTTFSTSRPTSTLNTDSDPSPEITPLRRDMEARYAEMHAQLESARERTNARIQAAIESVGQKSLVLRQEIFAVIQALEERVRSLSTNVVSRFDFVASLQDSQAVWPQPPLTGARWLRPYSWPTTSQGDDVVP
ncbi:hypothetical protein MRX96_059865 [Rhipicephalus microplus]